ncbi:MAG: 3-hydroxyacyl-CoA dehydrogenase family protein [Betaproteobacteria bacterium]|nr:3-hydroxyacyl-CoA dehydrogenase family protein [Betaproteobacteria bacterium]NDE54082.1 3-hydroxyacyl-CoA dehydrogenase family protein [Actinomycetota bacterium]
MKAIQSVAVVGAGTMGTGIAIVAARGGCKTIVFDQRPEHAKRVVDQAKAFLDRSVSKGKMTVLERDEVIARIHPVEQLAELADVDMLIEAVFESLQVKHEVFQALDRICKPSCVFASNTSTISITEIAGGSGREDRFIGLHFCLPAQLMKLVEVSRGLNTSDDTFKRAWDFCEQVSQRPVHTQDTPGFVLNYFLIPFNNDAIRLVEQGVSTPADIDIAIKAALGYAMGPFELLDLVGLDTQALLCEAMHGLTHEKRAACPPLVKRMIAAGRLGKKAGIGFHLYSDKKIFGA